MKLQAQHRHRAVLGHLRSWALWTGPPALIGWVLTTIAMAVAVTGVGALTTIARLGEVLTCLVLLGCAAVSVETVRRVGQPAGVTKDLLSVWTLPVALLLPPVYSLVVSGVLIVLRQLRIGRGLLHRRAFSAASIGLANWAVSELSHRCERWTGVSVTGDLHPTRAAWLAAALGAAVVGCAINVGLVGAAVRLSSPGTTWRSLLVDREQRTLDAGEICLGVVVTVCWLASPLLVVVLLLPVMLVQRSLSHAQLRADARLDAKTGLLNAKAWQGEAEREIVRAHREGQPLAVLIADLDHFKRVNDTFGHLAGDVALTAVVAALVGGLRPYDQLGRFGGEEFTVVLPRTGYTEAARVAERLRTMVCAAPVVLGDQVVDLSVSIGVAVLGEHGGDLTDLLAAADHALYSAKQSGRNQVAVAA